MRRQGSVVSQKVCGTGSEEQPQVFRLRSARKRPNFAQDDKEIIDPNDGTLMR
jgi:hypothetical protein